MPLPSLSEYPTKNITLPVSGIKVKFRPFTVKEEKVLVLHKDDDDSSEIDKLDAIMNLIHECTYKKVDPLKLPVSDVEYLFLQIRALSKGNISHLVWTCKNPIESEEGPIVSCDNEITVDINLEEIEMSNANDCQKEFVVSKKPLIKLFFEFPNTSLVKDTIENPPTNEVEGVYSLLYNCLKTVAEGDKLYTDFTFNEFSDFMGELPSNVYEEIVENFIHKIPTLKKEIHIVCDKCGQEEDITLQGVNDFF